jgi:hypothetical protein
MAQQQQDDFFNHFFCFLNVCNRIIVNKSPGNEWPMTFPENFKTPVLGKTVRGCAQRKHHVKT